ncbi:ABC transporter permease [Peptoniphilaceae bacterium SGI.137]|nr:ABC transporter permease [Peptoniphilaceae bacterium]
MHKMKSVFRHAAPSLIAICVGLMISIFVIIGTNSESAAKAIPTFFSGPFSRGWEGVGDMFYHAMPLLMTGLAVGVAFQTGMFNIGASGQFLFGGFLAILVCNRLEDIVPPQLMWILALLIAAAGGAFLAGIVGALKAYRNVNEVISCIMLNYISMYTVNDLIKRLNLYNQLKNNTVYIQTEVPKMLMTTIFPGTIASGTFVIGVIMVILLHIALKKTTFGYEIKGVGLNRFAAKYAGINEKMAIIQSMAIAGAMAGLGGGMLYLSGAGNSIAVQDVLPQEGFDGIAVALLGLNEPIGILLSALFFAFLKMGGQAIQTLGYAPELVTIIISFILYVSALSVLFQRLLSKKEKKKKKHETASAVSETASNQEEAQ